MSKLVNRIFKDNKSERKSLEDSCSSSAKRGAKSFPVGRRTSSTSSMNGRALSASPQEGVHTSHCQYPIADSSGPIYSKNAVNGHSIPAGPVEIPLEIALLLIGEEPPRVARSTPKGVIIDTTNWHQEHDMKHCIYPREIYEKLFASALKTCQVLQINLDTYILALKRQSSSRDVTPVNSTTDQLANGQTRGLK